MYTEESSVRKEESCVCTEEYSVLLHGSTTTTTEEFSVRRTPVSSVCSTEDSSVCNTEESSVLSTEESSYVRQAIPCLTESYCIILRSATQESSVRTEDSSVPDRYCRTPEDSSVRTEKSSVVLLLGAVCFYLAYCVF